MKKIVIIFFCIVLLIGCGNSIKVGNLFLKSTPNNKFITSKETGNIKFFPSSKSIVSLFNVPIILDSNFEHEIDQNGLILNGKTAETFSVKNNFAEFFIPSGTLFSYLKEAKSYIFNFSDDQFGKIVSPDITYNVREFLMFNEELTFAGYSDKEYSFLHEGKKILFIKNDNPVWDAKDGLDYNFYSAEYRDQIERDILNDKVFQSSNVLKDQFATHEGFGLQSYRGSWFFIVFDPKSLNLELVELMNDEEVIENFQSMKVGRTETSSFENKLVIDINVNQENVIKDGTLHLIIPSDEVDNIKRILSSKENLYLVFRMGNFSDFSISGSGIIYYSYNKFQLQELLKNAF